MNLIKKQNVFWGEKAVIKQHDCNNKHAIHWFVSMNEIISTLIMCEYNVMNREKKRNILFWSWDKWLLQ